ncbi:hypothetical protein JCM3770_006127 [Rhodotorula araucariae]
MSKQLVQLSLPGPAGAASIHATFISSSRSVEDLVACILAEDGPQIRRVVCGREQSTADDVSLWRIQRVLRSSLNAERNDEELAGLAGDGLLPPHLTIEAALGETASPPLTAPTRPSESSTQFSDFLLSGHLHAPALRLVFTPHVVEFTFEHIPAFPEGWHFRLFLAAETTAGEAIEAIVEELGVRKVVVHGHKTARVEYCLQIKHDGGTPQTLPTPARLLPFLQKDDPSGSPPYRATFTVSPSWLQKAGTVGFAIPGAASSASSGSSDGARRGITSRDGTGWRPGSLFGGFWGGEETPATGARTPADEEKTADGTDDDEGDGTLKAEKGGAAAASGATTSPSSTAGGRSRLSALFTEWIAPEASATSPPPAEQPGRPVSRIVGEPVALSKDLSRRFSSFTSGERLAAIRLQERDDDDDEDAPDEELEAPLEQLMDDLGLKDVQRIAMRQLPDDRKRFLVLQHRSSQGPSPEPLRPAKTGPPAQAGSSLLGDVKRFSLASVGWGGFAASSNPAVSPTPVRPVTTHGARSSSSPPASSPASDPATPHLQSQETGTSSSWTSWWTSPSNATGTGQASSQLAKDSPQFYRDQIRSTKISQRSLAKHLIALRVRLSTAKLAWAEEFVDAAQGLDALEELLSKVARRKADKEFAPSEEEKTVQIECMRCFRALMNTDIGFSRVVARPALVASIVFSLYSPSIKLRSLVADVLAALCLLSPEGHKLVLVAFSDARLDYGEKFRFEWLVSHIGVPDHRDDDTLDGSCTHSAAENEEADEAGFWEWRTAAMALVNAISNTPLDLEDRMILRDEFSRRGLNEAITGLRYIDPPDELLRQLHVYAEERQEDQEELHERTAGRSRDDTSNVPLGELIKLAQEHADLYPKLVDAVRSYITVFDRKDLDGHLRDDLITILDNFVEHAAHLEDFDHGWRVFMRQYLSSIVHIVGQQSLIRSSRVADTASVPTSFIEELEDLRTKVDELSEERTALRRELDAQTAETNTLRTLSVERSLEPAERSPGGSSIKRSDKENFAGVVRRLVQREKEVMDLKARLEGAARSEHGEEDARKDRANQNKRWENLLQEIGQNKVKIATLDTELESRDKEIKYLKRTLESVYSRFESSVASAIAVPGQPPRPPLMMDDPALMASHTLEALGQRDQEIQELKSELDAAKKELANAKRGLPRVRRRHRRHRHRRRRRRRLRLRLPPCSPHFRLLLSLPFGRRRIPHLPPRRLLRLRLVHLYLRPLPRHSCLLPKSPSSRPERLVLLSYHLRSSPAVPRLHRHLLLFLLPLEARLLRPVPLQNKPLKKMKPFFWSKLPPTRVGASVWLKSDAAPLELVDLEKEFAIGPALGRELKTETKVKKNQATQTLLSESRARNVGVMLARMRLPHAVVRDALLQLDDAKLSVDNLKAIKHNAPTADEIEMLRAFDGDVKTLATPDQYFLELSVIPRLPERLAAMLYRRRLDMEMEELRPDLAILRAASDELRSSKRFQTLLKTVLAIGNTLNGGTFRGGAAGFSLDSLLKLQDVRAASPSVATPTLLHYLVRVVRRQNPSLLSFLEEIPHVEAASRVSSATVHDTVQSLVAGVAQAKAELDVLKSIATLSPQDRFIPVMDQFIRHATPAMEALRSHAQSVSDELRDLLLFFGEDPKESKPEALFDLVAQFASLLRRADVEVQAADAKAEAAMQKAASLQPMRVPDPTPPPSSTLQPYSDSPSPTSALLCSSSSGGGNSLGRGQFDTAIRDLRNGVLSRRQRSTADRDRPLSRIFLSA